MLQEIEMINLKSSVLLLIDDLQRDLTVPHVTFLGIVATIWGDFCHNQADAKYLLRSM